MLAQYGPAIKLPSSSTLMPHKGPFSACILGRQKYGAVLSEKEKRERERDQLLMGFISLCVGYGLMVVAQGYGGAVIELLHGTIQNRKAGRAPNSLFFYN